MAGVWPPLSVPLNLLDLFYNITDEWYFKLGAVICYFFNCASWISKLPAWTRKIGIIGTFATLNRRQSWILDYTQWIPDSRYWIPVFVSGTFWILIVSVIADTLRCIRDSTSQDSGSVNKIPQDSVDSTSKSLCIPESVWLALGIISN